MGKGGRVGGQSDEMCGRLGPTLLASKTEEGSPKLRNVVPLEAGRATESPLEPPGRNTGQLTPGF